MKLHYWSRGGLAVVLALAALALGQPGVEAHPLPGPRFPPSPRLAAAGLPAQCGYFVDEGKNQAHIPIPDKVAAGANGVITSTLTLTHSLPYLWAVAVSTSISHTYSGDLELTLISPVGTRVTLSSRNGGSNDDVFANTIWSDSGLLPATDAVYSNSVVQQQLVPEEALGAFIGENGTGVWKLEVADEANHDTGTLSDWAMQVISLNRAPVVTTTSFLDVPVAPIPTSGVPLQLSIPVTGLASTLMDVNLITHIEHARPGALSFSLAETGGYSTTISTGSGGSNADWFDGTIWDDFAGQLYPPGPVTDDIHSSMVLTAAVPEGAMGHFIGADPNGTWTIFIKDVDGFGGGVLHEWGLDISTGTCAGGLFLPMVSRN